MVSTSFPFAVMLLVWCDANASRDTKDEQWSPKVEDESVFWRFMREVIFHKFEQLFPGLWVGYSLLKAVTSHLVAGYYFLEPKFFF